MASSSHIRRNEPPTCIRAWRWSVGLLLALAFTALPASAQTPVYDAKLARVDIFRNMATSGQYETILYYENTGTATWSEQDQIRLAIFPIPGLMPTNRWGTNGRLLLSEDIDPGGFATFTFTATAPVQAGHFTLLVQMIKESDFGFGEVLQESIEVNDMSQAIVVDGDNFREGSLGREWIPVGATIAPWYTDFSAACDQQSLGLGQRIWCEFEDGDDPNLVKANYEETFQDLARQGVNTVRSGFIGELFEPSIGQFNNSYCTHFNWTLDKAAEYGIRMIFSMSAPTRLQSLYDTQFCGTGASAVDCDANFFPTTLKPVILDPAVRDFTIERVWNFIGECDLLDRPEILSYRLFDEPLVPSDADRNRNFLVQLWQDHVIQTFGSVGNATAAWGFGMMNQPPSTCGDAGTLLCPPGPSDFCVEQTGPMANLAREYRRFFDVAYQNAYDDVSQALTDTANPQCTGVCPCETRPGGCPPQRALMSASFPSHIYVSATSPSSPSNECEGTGNFVADSGQWADPGWASEVFDYVALNVADWREAADWPILKLWIDYVRGGKPVVLHEFGRRADASGGPWEQWQVSLDQTRGAMDRHANGGQFHFYRDFQGFGGPVYGAKDIAGCPRPVFDSFPQLMERLKTARDTVNIETGAPLDVEPYSKVLLTNSILEALSAHQSRSAGGIVPIQRIPQIP